MKYAYEDLSWEQFERLIVLICQELFGISTRGFATGPDGGRDARFDGTANIYPSNSSPWTGTTIIQAKHTYGINKSFTESDFFSPDNSESTIVKEAIRIKKLVKSGELNHYVLFANRKLTGNTDSKIINYLALECKLKKDSISLCGSEQLEMYLKRFPHVPKIAEIDPVDSPLIVSPDDLSVIIEELGQQLSQREYTLPEPVPRTSYEQKNTINNMSSEYALMMRQRYLKEVKNIYGFLSQPENIELKTLYESVSEEFQFKIISKRKKYQNFDDIIEYLIDLLFSRDIVLRKYKRLTRVILFYMYWNCDIGMSDEIKS
ncbi:ABC-three component system protein [Maridesulfovibrio ferrireducens]|uniref:ABC-three component system protein n=1 Tax=Maridesulfovibrio ferrireducens TaxID=246191 RepID=UPI001A2FB7C6|nr:ABC-three component system protein [Maridesulfovibrio ferrireducens]MBI9112752.1 hypothetical protein [Maridesulfovibrio ferrireducens]